MMVIYQISASDGLDDEIEGTCFCRTYKECVAIRDELLKDAKDSGHEPPDIRIEQVTLAKLPTVELTLALLNRKGYSAESRQLWPQLKAGEKPEPIPVSGSKYGPGGYD